MLFFARRFSTKVKTLPSFNVDSSSKGNAFTRPRRVRIDPHLRQWESVIGLEVHAQIASKSKLFSAAPNVSSAAPNDAVSFFDAALPGTLPVLNRRCVEAGIQTALALDCQVSPVSSFDRKHYFYADLPGGYQITQQRQPLATNGRLEFMVLRSATAPDTFRHSVGITQIQLEQDSGKSLHDEVGGQTLVDLNRAGVGLMEIVFKPELFDGEEAAALIKELSLILKMLGTCTCQMEEGALRVDANVSVRPITHDLDLPDRKLGVRTEIKNLNSIRSVVRAIEFEVERQIMVLAEGGEVVNETRSFDFATKVTLPMRDKEAKQDYRFMPEPNLPPLRIVNGTSSSNPNILNIATFVANLPELPGTTRQMLMQKHGISLENAYRLVSEPTWLEFFKRCLQFGPKSPNILANWLVIEVVHYVEANNTDFDSIHLSPKMLVEIADMKANDELPYNILKLALNMLMSQSHPSAESLVEAKGWRRSARDMNRIMQEITLVMKEHPKLVRMCFNGKERGFKELLKILSKKCEEELDMALVAQTLRKEILAHMDP